MLRAICLFILAVASSGLAFGRQEPGWFERAVALYWDGEYEQTLKVLSAVPLDDLTEGESLEYHRYRALSYIALGDNDSAQREFISLLSTDSGFRFDTTMVSPKVIEQFDLSRQSLIETMFDQGKILYFDKDYATALGLMNKILRLDPDDQLAQEYKRLCDEQIALTERIASIEARENPPDEVEPEPEPAEEPDDKIYHMSSDITPPVLLEEVEPVYPPVDSLLRNEGSVVLLITIGKDGSVELARVVRSFNGRFDKAAIDAVTQWKYQPALLNGRPVRLARVISVQFLVR